MAVVRKPKPIRLAFRSTVEDFEMLNALVEKTGMASSDVIRRAIRALYTLEIGDSYGMLRVADGRAAAGISPRKSKGEKRTPRSK
jgi:hypothetical protein